MAMDDTFDTANQSLSIPKVDILTMFRLGLFQMGLSMMAILTLGVLNRVMIQEIAIPATIGSLVLAIPYLSPPQGFYLGKCPMLNPS